MQNTRSGGARQRSNDSGRCACRAARLQWQATQRPHAGQQHACLSSAQLSSAQTRNVPADRTHCHRCHAARTDRPQTTRRAAACRAPQHRRSGAAAGGGRGHRACRCGSGGVHRRAQHHVHRPARPVSRAPATHVDGRAGRRCGRIAGHLGRPQHPCPGGRRPVARPGRRAAGGARPGGGARGPDQHDPAGGQRRYALADRAGTGRSRADLRRRPAPGRAGIGRVAAATLSPGTLRTGRSDAPAGRHRTPAPRSQRRAAGNAGSARCDGDAARRTSLARDRCAELHHCRALRSGTAGAAVAGRCRHAPDRFASTSCDRSACSNAAPSCWNNSHTQ